MNTITRLALFLILFAPEYFRAQIQYNQADWGVHPMPYSRVGTAGFQFLKLPNNSRSMAMGGVLSAGSYGDARASLTNPASTADVKATDLFFGTMTWVADIQLHSFAAVRNFGEWGVIGVNLVYLNYGDMKRTEYLPDDFGNQLPVTEGLGTFTAHDLALGVSYARRITEQLQIGGNVRYIQEQLDDARTYTVSLDIGTLYWTGLGSWRISMLGKNFGPDAKFTDYKGRVEREPVGVRMPMTFVLGTAYDVLEYSSAFPHRVTLAAEYVKPNDGGEKVNTGLEYFFYDYFYFRAGYRFNYDEESFTFGFGAEYSIEDDYTIKVDYAYANTGRFNYVNLLTAGIGF